LVCFDKLKQPRKKLDGAIDIPYDLNNLTTFGQIEEEILSHNLSKEWGKIKLGLICYQKSSNPKADHFNLKLNDSIEAFIAEWRKNKKIQLCVYSERQHKRKEIIYGNSVIEDDGIEEPVSKKLRVSIIYFLLSIYFIITYIYPLVINKIFNLNLDIRI
jgi:hypothetical protein